MRDLLYVLYQINYLCFIGERADQLYLWEICDRLPECSLFKGTVYEALQAIFGSSNK